MIKHTWTLFNSAHRIISSTDRTNRSNSNCLFVTPVKLKKKVSSLTYNILRHCVFRPINIFLGLSSPSSFSFFIHIYVSLPLFLKFITWPIFSGHVTISRWSAKYIEPGHPVHKGLILFLFTIFIAASYPTNYTAPLLFFFLSVFLFVFIVLLCIINHHYFMYTS